MSGDQGRFSLKALLGRGPRRAAGAEEGGRASDPLGPPVRIAYGPDGSGADRPTDPAVVAAVAGRGTRWSRARDTPHLVGADGRLAEASAASVLWGAGVDGRAADLSAVRARNVHLLRGRLSVDALRADGVPVPDVPLGDPTLLLPSVLGVEGPGRRDHRLGVLVAPAHRRHPQVSRLAADPEAVDLGAHADVEALLLAMGRCAAVATTSLRALVLAEALGIPTVWVRPGGVPVADDTAFRDWFTTVANPPADATVLTDKSQVRRLAARAERRESRADPGDLLAAFPRSRLEELSDDPGTRVRDVRRSRARPTPVFLISFDRGGALRTTVEGLRRLSTPTEIVVHDNGSTDPATLEVLDELQHEGVSVERRAPISRPEELDLVDVTVQRHFESWGEPQRYVVSDCDIDLAIADPAALAVYGELLDRVPGVECVGPMLRISDIPHDYPLRTSVLNKHIFQFWQHPPRTVTTSVGEVAYRPARIDTTFALHRAGEPFRRLKSGLRVYEPYEARHLDWYETSEIYQQSASRAITNWSATPDRAEPAPDTLAFDRYTAVRSCGPGRVESYTVEL